MFFGDYVYQILIKSVHLDWVIQKWWEGGVFYETQCRFCWSHVQLKTMQPVASFVRMRHYWKSHTHVLPMCHASGDALITQYQYSLSNKRAQTDVSQYWVSAYLSSVCTDKCSFSCVFDALDSSDQRRIMSVLFTYFAGLSGPEKRAKQSNWNVFEITFCCKFKEEKIGT